MYSSLRPCQYQRIPALLFSEEAVINCTYSLLPGLLRPTQTLYCRLLQYVLSVLLLLGFLGDGSCSIFLYPNPRIHFSQRLSDRMFETLDTQSQTANMWECCEECTVVKDMTPTVF